MATASRTLGRQAGREFMARCQQNAVAWLLRVIAASLVFSTSTALLFGQAHNAIDLYTGIRQGTLAVKVNGSGVEKIKVRVTRRERTEPLEVRIPAGTTFVPSSRNVQNMVTVDSTTIDLTQAASATVSIPVVCANLHLEVPDSGDTFSVQQAPGQKELRAVIPFLQQAGVDPAVAQAAVWIVADNADYHDLGTLVRGFVVGHGSRVINPDDAARAMMLLEKAKVDLRSKAIWDDRALVCEGAEGYSKRKRFDWRTLFSKGAV